MPYNSSTKTVYTTVSNGVYYGVTWRDVQQALGVTDTDEHALCQSGRVKMLSRYKPIKDMLNSKPATKAVLSAADFAARNWGFDIPVISGSDLSNVAKKIVKGGYVWSTFGNAQLDAANIGNGWVYPAPKEGVNFARVTDFNGYNGSMDNQYQHDTLVLTNEFNAIGSVEKVTNDAQFTFDLRPYSPKNFDSLKNRRLGLAFWYAEDSSGHESDVYFYIGNIAISLDPVSENTMTLSMPNDMFRELLKKAILNNKPNVTFYAIGFFALENDKNKTNITGNDKISDLANVIPLPGLGYTTFRLQSVAGTGDYDRCLLSIKGIATSVPVKGSKTGFTAKIMSVTNNYDLINTDTGGTINFIPAYLQYTYDVFNVKGERDDQLSQDARTNFGNNTGITINVSNTEKVDNVVTHKTTDVSDSNITANIPVFQQGALAGYTVVVKLWYITYNSTPTDRIYRLVGQFAVTVDGDLSREA